MHSTKIALMISRTTRSRNGFLSRCFTSASTPPPSEGGSEGMGDKAKQTLDNALGAAKDTCQKVQDRMTETRTGTGTGTETGTSKPGSDPDMNHGVESTDSSCEDVRGRPGGYS